MVGCEIVNTPDLLRRVPESDKWFITADSARPETISHLQKHGYPKITYAKKGAGSVDDGVEFLKSFDIIVHPRCVETIRELTLYSYKLDKLTGAILPILEDKDNHIMDALRYACEGIRQARKPAKSTQRHQSTGSWM
jgi:phage terminase large subunit